MRFNKQELATLATQPSNKFEKEGILYVTERQDGFFRRTEGKYNSREIFVLFYFLRSFDFNHTLFSLNEREKLSE